MVHQQTAERTALQHDALMCVCEHRRIWREEQLAINRWGPLHYLDTPVKCDACLQELVAQAVRLPFMGDCEQWIVAREAECRRYERSSTASASFRLSQLAATAAIC
jgi:hypothetical protein